MKLARAWTLREDRTVDAHPPAPVAGERTPNLARVQGPQHLRVEEFLEENHYVLRGELPGVDPDKDLDIRVNDGVLTVMAERREGCPRDTGRHQGGNGPRTNDTSPSPPPDSHRHVPVTSEG